MKSDEFLDFVETEILEDEKKLIEQRLAYEITRESFESLLDKVSVYRKAKQLSANIGYSSYFEEKADQLEKLDKKDSLLDDRQATIQSNLKSISGIIKQEDELRLKRMVFRVSRGSYNFIIITKYRKGHTNIFRFR